MNSSNSASDLKTNGRIVIVGASLAGLRGAGALRNAGFGPIEPPHNDKEYFFEKDMADHGIARIRMLHAVAPDKPWLTYYAPGTAHAPHHAPMDRIAKFKG